MPRTPPAARGLRGEDMHLEHHGWWSSRLGKHMNIRVYGHYGLPLIVFPTSGGDEREYEGQSMTSALQHWIDDGRVKVFCINAVNNEGWYNKQAHPFHRSWLQTQFDGYVQHEVAPFVRWHCQSSQIVMTTTGASFGAYHALNTVLKHPDTFQRCIAMSGVYDIRKFMDGLYDDNFYFNNPADYVPGLNDAWYQHNLSRCDIRLTTGNGPWEDSGPTYRMSEILQQKGIPHRVDNWGADGGHDWPYWKKQIQAYMNNMF
jgi:esterase/lipase superfamily enzyme